MVVAVGAPRQISLTKLTVVIHIKIEHPFTQSTDGRCVASHAAMMPISTSLAFARLLVEPRFTDFAGAVIGADQTARVVGVAGLALVCGGHVVEGVTGDTLCGVVFLADFAAEQIALDALVAGQVIASFALVAVVEV